MEGFSWETPGILSFRRQLYICCVVPLNQVLYTLLSRHGGNLELSYLAKAKWHPIYGYPGQLLEILSTIVASFGTHYVGRKRWLIFSNLTILFGLLLQLSQINSTYDLVGFLIVRSGYNSGMVVGYVYVSEVSTATLRAFLYGTRHVGLRLAEFFNYLIASNSPLMNLIPLISIVFSIVISFLMPETPYWLAMNEETEAAEEALEWLRGNQLDDVEADELFEGAATEAQRKRAGLVANLWSPEFGWRLVILFCMHVNNFGAANMLNLYPFKWDSETKKYFYAKVANSSYSLHSLLTYMNRIAGAILFCVLSFLLSRRILLFGGLLLSYCFALSQFVASYSLRVAVYMQTFINFFDGIGPTPIPSLTTVEICSTITRSFGIAVFRIIFISQSYLEQSIQYSPTIDQWYAHAIFNIRMSLFPIGLVFLIFYMPETRNLSLTQTQIAARKFEVLFKSDLLSQSST